MASPRVISIPNCTQFSVQRRGCLLYFRLLTALAEVQGELEEEEKMMNEMTCSEKFLLHRMWFVSFRTKKS